jgi:glycosyltransferase involved in cell wall biosynthesis
VLIELTDPSKFCFNKLPTEAELFSRWSDVNQTSKPLVSICCITFNHGNYIQEALNSFLRQDTKFRFEIVIHDDASTDNTQEILKIYQSKYPNIIKLLIQKENQFSKGNFRPLPYTASYASGNYIAICEGDDKWICSQKLTKQVSVLTNNPNIKLCFHPTLYFKSNEELLGVAKSYSSETKIYNAKSFIMSGGGFCPTASLMITKCIFDDLPEWFFNVIAGDYYFQCFASIPEGGIFIPDVMSAYRWESSSSVTKEIKQLNGIELYKLVTRELRDLSKLDTFTKGKYVKEIRVRKAIVCQEFSALPLKKSDYKIFRRLITTSWNLHPRLNNRQRLLYSLRHIPCLLRLIQSIKQLIQPLPIRLEKPSNEVEYLFEKSSIY